MTRIILKGESYMVLREKFEGELQELKQKVIDMERFASAALETSYKALLTKDVELALSVIEDDKKLDKLEEELDELAILMIAKQQPVASDLRRIVSSIKIGSEIERVGDYAKNVAKTAIRLSKEERSFINDAVKEMHATCIEMLNMFNESFVKENVLLSKELAELDDRVDHLYGQEIRKILEAKQPESTTVNENSQLLFIVRHYERIGDHITNMAEETLYMIKGRHYHLNE